MTGRPVARAAAARVAPSQALTLRPLALDDEPQAVAAQRELAVEGFAFLHLDDGESWPDVVRHREERARGEGVREGWVPETFLVGVVQEADGEHLVGRISVRHRLNERIAEVGGHIGYGVRPTYRRRGYATAMLRGALVVARSVGLQRVLLTCDDDNIGSWTVIERCGGVFERLAADGSPASATRAVPSRRYWITVPPDLTRG